MDSSASSRRLLQFKVTLYFAKSLKTKVEQTMNNLEKSMRGFAKLSLAQAVDDIFSREGNGLPVMNYQAFQAGACRLIAKAARMNPGAVEAAGILLEEATRQRLVALWQECHPWAVAKI